MFDKKVQKYRVNKEETTRHVLKATTEQPLQYQEMPIWPVCIFQNYDAPQSNSMNQYESKRKARGFTIMINGFLFKCLVA